MLEIRLRKALKKRLSRLANATDRTEGYYVIKAIKRFLEENEDCLLAVSILEKNNSSMPLEDIMKKNDLEY